MRFLARWWWLFAIAIGVYLYCNGKFTGIFKQLGSLGGPSGTTTGGTLQAGP